MIRAGLLILIGLIFCCAASSGQEIYQWVDEKGILNFADDLSRVPERYRNQVRERKPSKELPPSPSAQTLKGIDMGGNSEPLPDQAPEQKDLKGRGEDWWKARAREWNEKLLNAQKNYEAAQTIYKQKEKELEESKFKPKSLQRKLTSELKALEEKANEWSKQREGAKNMLEKGLPKEAEEYHANPDWLIIE
jgi:hypothetical protein